MLDHDAMERAMRGYFDACNRGDVEGVASFLTDDAVHYFPPGMYGGPFVGARTIGRRWAEAVATLGSIWTVDQIITDPRADGRRWSGPIETARTRCCAATSGTASTSPD